MWTIKYDEWRLTYLVGVLTLSSSDEFDLLRTFSSYDEIFDKLFCDDKLNDSQMILD
jgi:hypothetical protein